MHLPSNTFPLTGFSQTSLCLALTDSKPCVEAFEKLSRGEFSVSLHVTTFLSTASRFQITLHHLPGCANLVFDFSSRNAHPCTHPTCQICTFINYTENSVVRNVTIHAVLQDNVHVPFANCNAWISMQNDCHDLRRIRAHLRQGTCPSKKQTNIINMKCYLQTMTVACDGLLVVHSIEPLSPIREKNCHSPQHALGTADCSPFQTMPSLTTLAPCCCVSSLLGVRLGESP